MREIEQLILIVQKRRADAEKRREAEEAYLEALKEVGVPEDSKLSKKHKNLLIYYSGRADGLLDLLIMLKTMIETEE